MSKSKTPTAVQKKKRLTQLRDAQRRRRERLRDDKQHFVQILLPEKTLAQLTRMIAISGETMQQIIARLVQSSLTIETEIAPVEAAAVPIEAAAEIVQPEPSAPSAVSIPFVPDIAEVEEIEEFTEEPATAFEESATAQAGQLDLFG